jgi:hypothetical protein
VSNFREEPACSERIGPQKQGKECSGLGNQLMAPTFTKVTVGEAEHRGKLPALLFLVIT